MPDLGPFILGAATIVVGQLVGLITDTIKQRRTEGAERTRRVEQRSEKAAEELIPILKRIQKKWDVGPKFGSAPDDEEAEELLTELAEKTVVIGKPEVQERLRLVTEALQYPSSIASFQGDPPAVIAYNVCALGEETLGAMLNDSPLPKDRSILDEYHAAIVEDHEVHEAMRQDWLEQQRKKREAKQSEG